MRVEDDDGLPGVGIAESFAIPQRAPIVRGPEATVMWDCISVVTDDAVERIGHVDAIAISHPHFYSAMVEWSDALGGVPIHVHAADREWIARPSERIEPWDGERLELTPGITLVHLPGHFPGSSALWWHGGDLHRRLDGVDFDDLYGFTWGLNVIGDARAAVDESLDRYLEAISA
ncbi:MAG: hypothetical protein QM733_00825 [Ilumatobacteraceae bacterium]